MFNYSRRVAKQTSSALSVNSFKKSAGHSPCNAMDISQALAGLPVPLHPGAARYFEEAGITIPDELK